MINDEGPGLFGKVRYPPKTLRIRYSLAGLLALGIIGGGIYATTRPTTPTVAPIAALSPAPPLPSISYPPQPVYRIELPPRPAVPSIYAAVRGAIVAAGVDEDKVDGPASDLSAAIEDSIRKPVDELWPCSATNVSASIYLTWNGLSARPTWSR
jgi:hypothetical protein